MGTIAFAARHSDGRALFRKRRERAYHRLRARSGAIPGREAAELVIRRQAGRSFCDLTKFDGPKPNPHGLGPSVTEDDCRCWLRVTNQNPGSGTRQSRFTFGAINSKPIFNLYARPRLRQPSTKYWQNISRTFGAILGLRS